MSKNITNNDFMIICPSCSSEIKLTEAIAKPFIDNIKDSYANKFDAQSKIINGREADLNKREQLIQEQIDNLAKEVNNQVKSKQADLEAKAYQQAAEKFSEQLAANSSELAAMQNLVEDNNQKLADAAMAQAEYMRKTREVEQQSREIELTIEKKVNNSLDAERSKVRTLVLEEANIEMLKKQGLIDSLKDTIESLKRKSEQGSQQLQGEILELHFETLLRSRFPQDIVEDVPKGQTGADLIQRINAASGASAGVVLWEIKNTRNWSDAWLDKLKTDQRSMNADIAVIATAALPKGVETFDCIDGIWVVSPALAVPLTIALRQVLISASLSRRVADGLKSKSESVYQYLTSIRFRQRIETLADVSDEMNSDLNREKKLALKQWSKREILIARLIESTSGIYGDLQALAGNALPRVSGIENDQLLGLPNCEDE